MRRGALFFINIGIPILVGTVRGDARGALLGAIAGMILSFADNEFGLGGRLRLLLFAAACMAVGGAAGNFLRGTSALWPAFVLVTFAAGLAARRGREALLSARNGAMAFAVATGIGIDLHEIWYLGGAFLLCALSRAVDHWLFGALPRLPAGPNPQPPSGYGGWFLYALAYSGAATSALWIGLRLDPIHALWVVTTTVVVMQADARASYRRIVERIAGTFAGVVVAWAITMLFHSVAMICGAILVVAPFIPHHLSNRYWLHTALIALMIMLAYDLTVLGSTEIEGLLAERMRDVLIGCTIALVGTAVAFPRGAAEAVGGDADEQM